VTVPLLVRLDGARVVCVGAGPVAAAKALPLLDEGADLVVVAPEAVELIAAEPRLTWLRRPWSPEDLDGAVLVIAATASPTVNETVTAEAARRSTLCVRVDRDGSGSADMAAAIRRGPLTIAVGTDGRAPAAARLVKHEIEARIGPEWGALVQLYAELRDDPVVRAALAGVDDAERRRLWRALPAADILRFLLIGDAASAKRVATACLSSSSV